MCLGIPAQIIEIINEDPLNRIGRVNVGGIVKEANLTYVPEAKVGDYVILHVGFAISIIDEEEAKKTLEYFEQMENLLLSSQKEE